MNSRGTGTTRSGRAGMTLTEILIAMLVLLVGIYTVARGFPLMLQNIRGEGDRTAMTRLAEETMARLKDHQYGLPEAIEGGGSISPYSFAEDLSGPLEERNAQENAITVHGETLRVPAPYKAPGDDTTIAAPSWYPLGQGPTRCEDWDNATAYPQVYMLVPLTEREDDPRLATAVDFDGNWFYVDKDSGEIVIPFSKIVTSEAGQDVTWTSSGVVVDYAWTSGAGYSPGDRPTVHYVQAETPSDVTPFPSSGAAKYRVCKVHPAHLPDGVKIVTGQTRAWARVEFHREPFGTTLPSGRGYYVLENRYGATLGFHASDTGLTLKVDYQLRTTPMASGDVDDRRVLMMQEEHVVEGTSSRVDGSGLPFCDIRLAAKGIDADEVLFGTDLQGAPLVPPVHVLAVDLTDGQTYTDGAPIVLNDLDLSPSLEDGYQKGLLAIPLQQTPGPAPASYVGHVWRFYYRTLDRHNIQVQRAPRTFVDEETARSYLSGYLPSGQQTPAGEAASVAEVDYRTYRLSHRAAPGDATRSIAVLEFGQWLAGETWATAESTSGFTVAVNYAYWSDADTREVVWGELHTVSTEGRFVALNHSTVATRPIEVLSLTGVSARARAWWLSRDGKQRQLDVETVLLGEALGLLPRAR